MAKTYFGSTLKSGSTATSEELDGGFVVLTKSVSVTTTADGLPVSASVQIPAGSQIMEVFLDKTVAQVVGGGAATTLPVTVGTVAAGTQYVTAVDMFTTVRAAPVLTSAQLLAMSDVGTNKDVFVTVDPNGTISTTQGVVRMSVVYAQKI